MKKINRIFVSLLAALPIFASCAKEVVEVGAPENTNSYGVYFETLTTTQKSVELDPADETALSFNVYRTKEEGDITVPVIVKSFCNGEEVEIFTASDIKFEDGQTEATFTVSFPKAEVGTTYTCQVSCSDPDYVYTYSNKPTGLSFEVTRVKWNLVTGPNGEEFGSWTDDIMSSMFGFSRLYAVNDKIKIYERDDKKGFYRINEVYNPYMLAQFWANQYPDEEFEENCTPGTINYIDATDPTAVWLPEQTTGATVGSDGYIEFASKVADNGFKDTADYGTMVNGVIKFPVDGILVNFTVSGGWYTANNKGKTVIVFPGCKDSDYSLKITAALSEEGLVPVHFAAGADLDKVLYATYEGVVGDADIHTKALEIFRDENALVAEEADLELEFEKTGKYTVVAVGLDADGEMQVEASAVLTYVASDDPVPVVVSCGIGSAAKYKPQGVSTDNAVEFYVYGEDLVDVKISAVKKLDLVSDSQAVVTALLKSKSISADDLKLVNGEGLSGYIGKLLPGTEYYLVVYASNGYEEKVVLSETSEFTTGDPLPIYQNFGYGDVDENLYVSEAKDLYGKYNFYAIDPSAGIGMRQYVSKVTISDSGIPATEPDGDGLVDEFPMVSGIFAKYVGKAISHDKMLFDFYDGVLYSLADGITFGKGLGQFSSFYMGVCPMDDEGYSYAQVDYALLGLPVADGYIAFLPSSSYQSKYKITFTGLALCGFSDEDCTSDGYKGALAAYQDLLLVAEGKDNNGIAPKAAATTAAIALQPVLDELHKMPVTYIESHKSRIRRAIDKAKSKLLWGEPVSVAGSVDCPKANVTVSAGSSASEVSSSSRTLKANLRSAVIR